MDEGQVGATSSKPPCIHLMAVLRGTRKAEHLNVFFLYLNYEMPKYLNTLTE